jgi:hypothetical protein
VNDVNDWTSLPRLEPTRQELVEARVLVCLCCAADQLPWALEALRDVLGVLQHDRVALSRRAVAAAESLHDGERRQRWLMIARCVTGKSEVAPANDVSDTHEETIA